jgi:hypothetical protein
MQWQRVSGDYTSHLSNYIFVDSCCFAETNICLAGVASFNVIYFNLI